jgi:uncharacterized radical SAM superfamily Fe-S cluster-containing enzyme
MRRIFTTLSGGKLLKFIKHTKSLCPICLKVVDASLYEEDGQVIIRKKCLEHGFFEDTYWSSFQEYERATCFAYEGEGILNPRTETVRGCPYDCGICPQHRSHTVLAIIDVTNRCNLRCPICFANAATVGYVYEPTKEKIYEMLKNFRSNRPFAPEAIQFSGGEPTVREDLPELIRMAKDVGFDHVEVNTNGLRAAQSVEYMRKLMEAGMDTFYLQFDGLSDEIYRITRGCDLLQIKLKVIENARKVGLDSVVLVPTLIRGVNDHQVGDIINFAVENFDVIRGVNFQPVSVCGRIDRDKLGEMRITIPDFMKLCEDQTKGEIKVSDFYTVPTVVPLSKAVGAMKGRKYSEFTVHPHCGVATFIFKEGDKITPITRYANVEKFMLAMERVYEDASEKKRMKAKMRLLSAMRYVKFGILRDLMSSILRTGSYDSLGKLMRRMLLIGCMHFMDPYNFDLERVQRCCIHYGVPDGRIIPFCSMNSIHREAIERQFSVPLEEWKQK